MARVDLFCTENIMWRHHFQIPSSGRLWWLWLFYQLYRRLKLLFLRYGVISLYGLSSWVGAGVKEVYFLVHQFVFIFWIVTFHVQRQVVGAREATVTWLALKRLGSRVLPDVTCQLVGARELPRTVLVRALVGLFSCRNKQAVTLQRS